MQQMQQMQILAVSGSLRATSTIGMFVRAVAKLAPPWMAFAFYDGLDDLPHFAPDRDGDPPPVAVAHLRGLLRAADGVLLCTPEYAYGMPGAFKNALDWTVSSGEFVGKPVAALAASPYESGGQRAHAALLLVLTALSAEVAAGASVTVPLVRTVMDADGDISDSATAHALRSVLDALAQAIDAARLGDA